MADKKKERGDPDLDSFREFGVVVGGEGPPAAEHDGQVGGLGPRGGGCPTAHFPEALNWEEKSPGSPFGEKKIVAPVAPLFGRTKLRSRLEFQFFGSYLSPIYPPPLKVRIP